LRSEAPHVDPAFSEAQTKIAASMCAQGDFTGAVAVYHQALQTHPDVPELLNNLAWLLATCPEAQTRDGVQAVRYAERACELTHYGATPLIGTLAAAYAEAGRFDDAIATAEHACDLAAKKGETNFLQRNQELLERYRAHKTALEE
jgi:Flp pilus assembly protein TadD